MRKQVGKLFFFHFPKSDKCWRIRTKSKKLKPLVSRNFLCGRIRTDFSYFQEFRKIGKFEIGKSPSQWARRDRLMSRGKNCRETIFVSHLSRNYLTGGVNFEKRIKSPLLWGRDSLGGILGDNLARVIASQKLPRDSGETIFAARHQSVSQGPLGVEFCFSFVFPSISIFNFSDRDMTFYRFWWIGGRQQMLAHSQGRLTKRVCCQSRNLASVKNHQTNSHQP